MEQAHAERQLRELGIAELLTQRRECPLVEDRGRGDDGVRQRERRRFPWAERTLIAVDDLLYRVLGEPRLTGGVESNVLSVAAVGDPRVADTGHFLDRGGYAPLLPEPCVEGRECSHHFRCVGQHVAQMGRLAGDGGLESWNRGHGALPRA